MRINTKNLFKGLVLIVLTCTIAYMIAHKIDDWLFILGGVVIIIYNWSDSEEVADEDEIDEGLLEERAVDFSDWLVKNNFRQSGSDKTKWSNGKGIFNSAELYQKYFDETYGDED